MTQIDSTILPMTREASAARRSSAADLIALAKPGIVRMVLVTTGVGFAVSAIVREGGVVARLDVLAWCILGTALSAAGANALNMAVEGSRDRLMHRTRLRPVPAGRMSAAWALRFGLLASALGVACLALMVNPAAALVSLATIVSYVVLYTPLKPVTPLATIIGAVPGALPPLIGWAAGAGLGGTASFASLLEPGGWSIVLIMFVWQIPHFLALAWKYREDYARAGHRVLTVVDPTGERTVFVVVMWSMLLLPVSLLAGELMADRMGWIYKAVALLAGLALLAAAAGLAHQRTDRAAMRLFFASIIYLPVVLLAMVADAALTAAG